MLNSNIGAVVKPDKDISVTLSSSVVSGGRITIKESSDSVSCMINNIAIKTAQNANSAFVIATYDNTKLQDLAACMTIPLMILNVGGHLSGMSTALISGGNIWVISNVNITSGCSLRGTATYII